MAKASIIITFAYWLAKGKLHQVQAHDYIIENVGLVKIESIVKIENNIVKTKKSLTQTVLKAKMFDKNVSSNADVKSTVGLSLELYTRVLDNWQHMLHNHIRIRSDLEPMPTTITVLSKPLTKTMLGAWCARHRKERLPLQHRRHGTGFQLTINQPVILDHSRSS